MVAPKNTAGATKEKSDEKKSISASPEPFQEPDGMMTIDLNKSDDYTKETEAEKEKNKQRAQIRYVAQLLFALGSILFVVLTFITVAFLNREYHLFTVIPLKINQSQPNPAYIATPSPTEEFVNLTKILNQALFKERLKSGNYLENSNGEMNLCRLKQTVDACCEVFKTTDLNNLAEFCTVNDMLDILLEFEMNRRKKRQLYNDRVFENIEYQNAYLPAPTNHHDYFNQYKQNEYHDQFLQAPPDLNPTDFNHMVHELDSHFEMPDQINPRMNLNKPQISNANPPHPKQQIIFVDPNVSSFEHQSHINLYPQDSAPEQESPNVQSALLLSEQTRGQILHHVTIAPKREKNYRYEDFHKDERESRFEHQPNEEAVAFVDDLEEARNSRKYFDRTSNVHNVQVNANGNLHFIPANQQPSHFGDKFVESFRGNENLQTPIFNRDPEDKEANPDVENENFFPRQNKNSKEIQKEPLIENDQKEFAINLDNKFKESPLSDSDTMAKSSEETLLDLIADDNIPSVKSFEKINLTETKQGHNKPLVPKFEHSMEFHETSTINSNKVDLTDSDDSLPDINGNGNKNYLDTTTMVPLSFNNRSEDDSLSAKSGDFSNNNPQNIAINLNNTKTTINLAPGEDQSQIKSPPNLKVLINKDGIDLTSEVLPGAKEAHSEPESNGTQFKINEEPLDLKNISITSDIRPSETLPQQLPSAVDFTDKAPSGEDGKLGAERKQFRVGDAQKKPLVSKYGATLEVRKNITSYSNDTGTSISLTPSEDQSQINIPPNLKITKNKDDIDLTTSVLPGAREAYSETESNFTPFKINEEPLDSKNISLSSNIRPSEMLPQHVPSAVELSDKTKSEDEKLGAGSIFGSTLEVRENAVTNSNDTETSINLTPSEDHSQINIPPTPRITKHKDDIDLTTSVLPGAREAYSETKSDVTQFNINEEALDLKNISFTSDIKTLLNDLRNSGMEIKHNSNPQQVPNENVTSTFLNIFENNQDSNENLTLTGINVFENSSSNSDVVDSNKETSKINNDLNLKVVTNSSNDTSTLNYIDGKTQFNINENVTPNLSEIPVHLEDIWNIGTTETVEELPTNTELSKQDSKDIIANNQTSNMYPTKNDTKSTTKDTVEESLRSSQGQDDFRAKPKQLDGFTATEDVQSNQQSFINPCFYPYMNPYMPVVPPTKVGSTQDPGYLKIVSVSQPKVQNQPMYVLNPAMYYNIPPSPPTTFSSFPSSFPPNPYLTPNYYPPMAQTIQNPVGVSHTGPVQVAAPGGQYYMCNPIPSPSNNIAGLAGVEVRRDASNLQNLMADVEDFVRNNKSRDATLICPLGEQACLDNSKCIKNHHICDNEAHCDDTSDEIACSCKERVGKLRLCDGYCDCPRCEDEQGCFGCEETEFSCDDWSRFRRSTCIPIVQRCDGIKHCEITGKDEMDCSILTDHIGDFPLSKISNSVGFLHRNYKGKWYPTCFGTELWAAQVCHVEAGPSAIIPKAHMTLTTDPYNGLFINILPNNEVSLVNTCVQDRAAFVECPPIYCGLRFLVNNPYRAQEVDTDIEDMLNDLERAYHMRDSRFERSDLDSDTDSKQKGQTESSHRLVVRENSQDHNKSTSGDKESNTDLTKNNGSIDDGLENTDDFRIKGNLTHEHLEEVIENLEKTFKRRAVSADERFSATLKENRVVGGKPSQPAAWPWLVLIYKNGIFHCGGVLINELWVVTASHCVDRFWQYYYEIQAGALRRFSYAPMDQRRWAKIVIPHEFYSKTNLRNDIALMKLSAPIRYNRYVRPICLPSETTAGQDFLKGPSAGTICTTVGWGATVEHGVDPDHMREVEVPILQHCKHKEDSDVEEICAGLSEGGKDACQGDSGGPFMCRNPNNPNQWYLAGIVSHGEGCARPNEPGVYTKVSRYIGWIAENTRQNRLTLRRPLQKCPGYICKGTKRCIAKKRRCDRIIDCLLGDDEMDCENRFREIFKHSRTSIKPSTNTIQPSDDQATDIVENLVPLEEFGLVGSKLNSTKGMIPEGFSVDKEIVEDSEDARESEKAKKQVKKVEDIYFKCEVLLQVIPIEKKCDKIFDCEDGSDELGCSCADHIKTIDASAICDGITDCPDLSDESDCVRCNQTEYSCRLSQKCIDISKRCDGNSDCPQNEDEMNCASLTNGHALTLDKDHRPMFKSRGIVTINHQGQWKPLCLNSSSSFVNDEASLSTVICNLLGFDEYLTYHKYHTEDGAINSSYSVISGRIILDPEPKKCDSCCDGLYVSCSNTSSSTTLHYKSLEQVKELYFSPWMVAIYSKGQYKCMGTLLDHFWIVTSAKCITGIHLLETNHVVAVFGKGKLHFTVKGPHEQIIRVSGSVNVNDSDIVLLRLEVDVKFNRYVQAADLNVRRDGLQKEKCYAVGQNNENKVMFVPLIPLKNCLVGFRCFEKKIEEDCEDNHPWSGTIICDSRVGWYPAAVFNEESGHCGFSHEKKYTSVKFYKNQIFHIMTSKPKSIPPPLCVGFQCPLGNCISHKNICDGIKDCYDGEDERTHLCYEKEKQCHLEDNCVCPPTHLKCPTNNKCFPKSSFCDRTNDCGEFEDEPDVCSCRNYLRLTNPEKICDGTLNCMDRSDEDPEICSCKLEDFQCGKLNKCIPQEMVCDGVKDCPNGEDETKCLSLKKDDHESTNVGEVMTRTAGIWHPGCFDLNYSTPRLEDICAMLGFNGSSANQLAPPHNLTTLFSHRPVLDPFGVVWLRRQAGNKLKLRLRSGHDPYVKFVTDKKCHRLFVACI